MNKTLEKFLRKRKLAIKNPNKYEDVYDDNVNDINFYLKNKRFDYEEYHNDIIPFEPWESVTSELAIPQNYLEMQAQRQFIQIGQLDVSILNRCLSYGYYDLIISYVCQSRYSIRFNREFEYAVSPESVFSLVIAVLLGQTQRAQHIFQLFEQGYAKNWVNRSKSHIGDFIILLFDKVRGTQNMNPIIEHFAYQEILDNWQTDDFDLLCDYLTQLCDDQVTQVAAPPSKDFFEFDSMNWQFTPYAALMLLALRAQQGVENPDYKHPAFGQLTKQLISAPVKPEIDEPLSELLKVFNQQGFDEHKLMENN